MKKLLLLASVALFVGANALAQGVYQIPNSDFDAEWTSTKEPGNGWNSFASATGDAATAGKDLAPNPSQEAGRSGNCVKIFSKFAGFLFFGANANGNLTTGMVNMGSTTPADASNHNYTKRDDPAHSLPFSAHPDAVEFYAKFKKGGSPNGRGQFILHGDVDYQDPENDALKSERVAIASVLVPPCDNWTRFSGEFTYDARTSAPTKQYLLASFTTNPTPGGSKDDELWIDDVKLIYYHALSALSYGEATLDFNEATTSYDLSSEFYEPSKLSYTKKGQAAKVTTSYNEDTAVLTIRVEGEDFSETPESVTTYTIQFGKSKLLNSLLTSVQFNGESITPVENEVVKVAHIYKESALTFACEADPEAQIAQAYDPATGILTVTVTGSDADKNPANVHTYKFQFNLPLNSLLTSVQFNGESITPVENEVVEVAHLYKESALTFACEADPAATIVSEYNAETGVLTVTVTGSDVAENPENVHTYKFRFNLPSNSAISLVTYGGEEITLNEAGVTVVDHIYKEGQLKVVCDGDKGALVEESYDEATGVLTVTVTGSDVAENPENVHTYKFQFNLPLTSLLTSIHFNGESIAPVENEVVKIAHIYKKEALTFTCEADPEAAIVSKYDEATGVLTVTVTGSDVAENPANVHTYKFQFNKPLSSVLTSVVYDGQTYAIEGSKPVVIDHLYEEGKFVVTCEADLAATIVSEYNAETGQLIVTVTGSDVAENPENVHTYKFQFNLPFNSEISLVTYGGEEITLSEEGSTVVDHIYKEGQLEVVCAGDKGAKVEESYDEATGVLTVTVTGSDVAENPENVHIYKFQFNLPLTSLLTGVKFNEETVTPVENEVVKIAHIYKKEALTFTCEADPEAAIASKYDEATCILTVTVTGSDVAENPENVHTYKFQFNKPLSSVLTSVVYDGQTYAIEGSKPVVIDHLYEEGKFVATCEADPAATIVSEYNAETGQLIVTVTGSDVAENPENVHTYKFQFNLPFNSEISLVTYGGEEITLSKEGTTVVDHIYKEGQLEVVCAGDKGAKVEENYDEATGLLTVTVTGSDVAENPENVHIYKFQFNLPLNSVLSGVTYNGKDIEFSETETTTIEGSYDEKAFTAECEADADATIEYAYDADTDVLTVTVTGSDVAENPENVHTYKFQFTVPVGISPLFANSACDVYTLSGKLVRKNATTLVGLPKGIYIVNGKKIIR